MSRTTDAHQTNLAASSEPFGIASLAHCVWVSYGNGGDGVIAAIDPSTNHIVLTVPVHAFDRLLGTGAGSGWAADFDDQTAIRTAQATTTER